MSLGEYQIYPSNLNDNNFWNKLYFLKLSNLYIFCSRIKIAHYKYFLSVSAYNEKVFLFYSLNRTSLLSLFHVFPFEVISFCSLLIFRCISQTLFCYPFCIFPFLLELFSKFCLFGHQMSNFMSLRHQSKIKNYQRLRELK